MGWITMTLRKQSLIQQQNDLSLKIMQIGQQIREYANFATAAADGKITTGELSGIATELIPDVYFFGQDSSIYAQNSATQKIALYRQGINTISALQSGAVVNPDGLANLDEPTLYMHCLEEAQKEYVENTLTPLINEKQKELETLKTKLETELKAVEAEQDALDNSIDNQIGKTAIKLS